MDDLKFKKYANWVSKSDPDMINTVDEVAMDGTLIMSDGEEYSQEALMSTHIYMPAVMQFKEEIMAGDGIDPADRQKALNAQQTYGLDLAMDAGELLNDAQQTPFPFGSNKSQFEPVSVNHNGNITTGGNLQFSHVHSGGTIYGGPHQQQTFPPTIFQQVTDPVYTALKQMCKDGDTYVLPSTDKFKLFIDLFNIKDTEQIDELFKQLFREPEIVDAVAKEYSSKIISILGLNKVYGPVDSINIQKDQI